MSNSFGRCFRITSFGESHGRCIGVVVDGCPAGLKLSEEDVQRDLDRRRPAQSLITSARGESDRVELLSGVFKGYTTGAPICMIVENVDVDSEPYEKLKSTPRPGHADYAAYVKYGGFADYRGGGRFSGRITAGFVMAGSVAKKLLKDVLGVEVLAHCCEIGGIKAKKSTFEEIKVNVEETPVRCADLEAAEKMLHAVEEASKVGDSLGGVVECIANPMPVGIGDPVFDTLEGDISSALFSIPAVKSVEFGAGRMFSRLRGSESNDEYVAQNGRVFTETNWAGGILGGISNGMPLVCRATLKPTPSIRLPQRTVDLSSGKETVIRIEGRHDPCIAPRAVPVVEAMVAVVIADHAMASGFIPRVIRSKEK
ncbi:chorismate synthase [Candidatus Bathyarchaeota archaeon]|nr:chorismate synthase [Candidatus Bathyarchaeota archaeon]MBS7631331.1 chorismate synthase [Candidatus Bathyarchaeota archaeon]